MNKKNKPAALILAAGNSGRMGKIKAFLPFDENRTFLDKILSSFFMFGCSDVWIVLNEQGIKRAEQENYYSNVHLVLNEHPEKERFFSLQTGLKVIPEDTPVFLHNADNPFINTEVLSLMWDACDEQSVVVPELNGKGGHPVLLPPDVVEKIIGEQNESVPLNDFLQNIPQQRIAVSDTDILININSSEDYQRFFGKVLK
ncbi:MAG: NTP transferase domain-containing protein [Bacteroidales bacterium]|nr:NTP transferase domain-containing protein [Bacteroidales bacterium]